MNNTLKAMLTYLGYGAAFAIGYTGTSAVIMEVDRRRQRGELDRFTTAIREGLSGARPPRPETLADVEAAERTADVPFLGAKSVIPCTNPRCLDPQCVDYRRQNGQLYAPDSGNAPIVLDAGDVDGGPALAEGEIGAVSLSTDA
ncbi:MAG TPA: hypothetical protein VIO38_17250 [Rariglobus sp.]